ncbi:hypothetical protein FOZ60_006649 [Perkinsus olseni]|uniref:Peptidase A1 domain-containing protein n=1 Tax=Perkinsus olseni TaxID=32597 RepID=A0A7J6NNG1_PEROL|nr:hypothetical protein FOZ60_006649 [Perkinsus olseni]
MLRAAILHSAVSWKLASTSPSLTFPLKNNHVEMNFDGRNISLLADSGGYRSYLVYGGWYESIYGPDSCKDSRLGMLLLPSNRPIFVERRVSLKLSKGKIRNLRVGLMIGSSRIEDGKQPFATLGLSIPSSKPITEAAIPPLLSQLVSAGAISETAFSVRVSEFGVGITGQLILGESAAKREDTKSFPLGSVPWSAALFAIPGSGVRVQSTPHGGHVRELSMKRDSLPVAIDTGCDVTTVPKEVFSMIWATIASTFGHQHVASRPSTLHPTSFHHLYARIDPKGWIWLRRTMTEYLPRIIVQGAAGSTFEVDLSAGGSPDAFILGGPFLAQHDVYVNLDRKEIGISTPDRPVVKQFASHESWDQMRAPPCGRRAQSCSTVATRRCIKRPVRKRAFDDLEPSVNPRGPTSSSSEQAQLGAAGPLVRSTTLKYRVQISAPSVHQIWRYELKSTAPNGKWRCRTRRSGHSVKRLDSTSRSLADLKAANAALEAQNSVLLHSRSEDVERVIQEDRMTSTSDRPVAAMWGSSTILQPKAIAAAGQSGVQTDPLDDQESRQLRIIDDLKRKLVDRQERESKLEMSVRQEDGVPLEYVIRFWPGIDFLNRHAAAVSDGEGSGDGGELWLKVLAHLDGRIRELEEENRTFRNREDRVRHLQRTAACKVDGSTVQTLNELQQQLRIKSDLIESLVKRQANTSTFDAEFSRGDQKSLRALLLQPVNDEDADSDSSIPRMIEFASMLTYERDRRRQLEALLEKQIAATGSATAECDSLKASEACLLADFRSLASQALGIVRCVGGTIGLRYPSCFDNCTLPLWLIMAVKRDAGRAPRQKARS